MPNEGIIELTVDCPNECGAKITFAHPEAHIYNEVEYSMLMLPHHKTYVCANCLQEVAVALASIQPSFTLLKIDKKKSNIIVMPSSNVPT